MTAPAPLTYFDFAQRLPPFGLHFPTRMTVLPFGKREVALVSPVPIDDQIAASIAKLGEVRYLIAPNLLHHFYLGAASRRYPSAKILAPAGLREKVPDLTIDATLEQGLPFELAAAVELLRIDGAPAIDEFVFFHSASRTLVVTDLVFNFVRARGTFTKLVLFLVGCYGHVAQSRAWRFTIKDRHAASASAQRVLALPFHTLIVAHGDVMQEDARAQLAQALSWQARAPS